MYSLYTKDTDGARVRCRFTEDAHLAGCNVGYIPRFLAAQLKGNETEPLRWHVAVEAALQAAGKRSAALVINLKPHDQHGNLSIYEVRDLWGYSDRGWTPIMLRLVGLCVDGEPRRRSYGSTAFHDFLLLSGGHGSHLGRVAARITSGTPSRSTSSVYFVPFLRRSTGLGPVASPPPNARTCVESMIAVSRCSSFSFTQHGQQQHVQLVPNPARSQACSRVRAVSPQQPISWGTSFQRQPVTNTNQITFNTL